VPRGAFGPRLQAAIATLAVRNRISRRDTTELFRELFGARISAGSIDAVVQRTATALEEPYEDLLCHIRAARTINVDETGWRLRGGKRTLWGALTVRAAVFRIAPDRHSWARSSPASPAPIAGGPTTTSPPNSDNSAGRT